MRATALSLVWLARPKGAWLVASVPLVGFGYGLWERASTVHPRVVAPTLALLFGAWLLMHAGSLWLNAELDRDDGPVLLGRPVPVPRGTAAAGYLALALAVALAAVVGPLVAVCAAGCALLAVLYSHPRVALKGRPLGGPLVNAVGYGTLSPIAGWAAADGVFTWRAGLSLAFAVALMLSVYFSAQAFQRDEDRRRGYRTLVATHGPAMVLAAARVGLGVGVLGVLAGAAIGFYPRTLLVAAPVLVAADRHLARWRRAPNGGNGRLASGYVHRLALAALVAVLAAYASHFAALLADAPPGGCATAVVPDALAPICGK